MHMTRMVISKRETSLVAKETSTLFLAVLPWIVSTKKNAFIVVLLTSHQYSSLGDTKYLLWTLNEKSLAFHM